MDLSLERDSSVIGSLFQQIITDMKNTSPLWEDFVAKASKLHACLRAAIQAIAAYLDAFQKIADAATNSRGASKEIGTALTRVCLRHKAVETRMKTFTTAIMDCLIIPLQDKLEDWKRQVATLDKEHAKEYKRCRTELKKRSSDTLRLQKKARKGQSDTIQSLVDSHMQDVTMRRAELEEVEKKSLRAAMIEERMRYCSFVNMLQPVVKEECEVMSELGHLQEAMQSIAVVTKEPNVLPQSSEELILESKSTINLYPESPGGNSGSQGCSNSLGSRKSSVCSISSMNSSGSSGSPGHHHYQRSLSQLISPAIRLKPGESSDSGFCSSPALTSQASTNTSQSHAISTWPPHSQDAVQTNDRPHTISSAYEKGHQRPALTVYTFQNPETILESQKSPATMVCRPPLPVRCSSLERPLSSTGSRNTNVNLIQRQCPSPIPAHITKELPQLQPTYVNMSELASMAASKITNQQLQQQQQLMQQQQQSKSQQQQPQQQQSQPCLSNSSNSNQTAASSQLSSDSFPLAGSQTQPQHHQQQIQHQTMISPDQSSSAGNTENSSATITTTATTGTTPPSSGGSPLSSLSQNNSPQLTNNTNSPQTPVNSSSAILVGGNNTNNSNTTTTTSNTTPTSVTGTTATCTSGSGEELKITETDNTTYNSSSNNTISSSSPENDDKSRGSVLEKTSMFEKLEQKQSNNNNISSLTTSRNVQASSNNDSIFTNRKEEIYKSTGTNDKDPDQIYEDSIQELNNLIGELDSFQREHEMKEQSCRVNQQDPQQQSLEKKNYDQQASIDTDSDKISIGSLNYSTQSTNASEMKFNYSDSEVSRYMSETGSMGFENPTFAHLNSSNDKMNDVTDGGVHLIPYDSNYIVTPDVDYLRQNSEIVVLRCKESTTPDGNTEKSLSEPKQRLSSFKYDPQSNQQQLLQHQQHYHSHSELLQQQKQHQQEELQQQQQQEQNNQFQYDQGTGIRDDYNVNNLKMIERSPLIVDTNVTCVNDFKANLDERLRSKPVVSPRPASLSGCVSRITRRSSVNSTKPPPPVRRSSSVTPSHNLGGQNSPNLIQQSVMNTSAESLPPPPAFLLDRNSVNASPTTINVAETVKALTVIRHTPASPSALRRAQNQMNQVQTVQNNTHINNNTTTNLSPTPKNEVPVCSMYTQQQSNSNVTNLVSSDSFNSQFRTQNSTQPGIYAQPKQVAKMSSFRTPSPGPQKTSSGLLAQLNARLTPNKQNQQQHQHHHHHQSPSNDYSVHQQQQQIYQDNRNQQQQGYSNSGQNSPHHHGYCTQTEQIYSHAGDRYYYGGQQQQASTQQQQQQQQQYYHHHQQKQQQQQHHHNQQSSQQYDDFSPSNNEKAGSIRSKTKAEFLENLNAKLAKQGLSGRAFAVRNLINSKALPDPRLCHESLMDQIKRGATLKRNRTINDRSAPKIH